MNMRGMTYVALKEAMERETELRDAARARCKNLRSEIVTAQRQLRDLHDALRVLSLQEGEHNDNRAMAQAYLDMKNDH